jgi:hypothetical protein
MLMAVAALKLKAVPKTFYATMHVTRVEEWCVEAETAEEARKLLLSGGGQRSHIGECIHAEVDWIEE